MAGVSQWQEHGKDGYVDGDVVRYSRPKLFIEGDTDFWKAGIFNIKVEDYVSNSFISYPVVE